MTLGRRGFLGAVGALAGATAAKMLSPGAAEVIKFGPEASQYGDDLVRDMWKEGQISEETARQFVSTPLRQLTPAQKNRVALRYLKNGTKEYVRAGVELMDSTDLEKDQMVALLTNGDEVFEGPMLCDWEEKDDPWRLVFRFTYPCDRAFTYDGIQVMTWKGDVFAPGKFSMPVNVVPGDDLNLTWTFSI